MAPRGEENTGSGFSQCRSFSLIFSGMPVATAVPQQVFSAESPLPQPVTAQTEPPSHTHTHTHTQAWRRMYHEGPPAVAVTDTGNAQNTSIIKIWHAHSLSCASTPTARSARSGSLRSVTSSEMPLCLLKELS